MKKEIGIVLLIIISTSLIFLSSSYLLNAPTKDALLNDTEKKLLSEKTYPLLTASQRREKLDEYFGQRRSLHNESIPTENQYVNPYIFNTTTRWIPEDNISVQKFPVGIYEHTKYPNVRPNRTHFEKAWALYNDTYEVAERRGWFDFNKAKKQGWYLKGEGNHWANIEDTDVREHMGDLYPILPAMLVFYDNPKSSGKILAGVMFKHPEGSQKEGEQIAGPLTIWHRHPLFTSGAPSAMKRILLARPSLSLSDVAHRKFNSMSKLIEEVNMTSEMLHVWFAKHPEGPFGTTMRVPKENLVQKQPKMNKTEFIHYTNKTYYNHRVNPDIQTRWR